MVECSQQAENYDDDGGVVCICKPDIFIRICFCGKHPLLAPPPKNHPQIKGQIREEFQKHCRSDVDCLHFTIKIGTLGILQGHAPTYERGVYIGF